MKKLPLLILLTTIILYGCSNGNKGESEKESGKLKVMASTYPMYYLTNEIGKDSVDLDIIIPIGVDPHEYDLSLKEIAELEKADLFIYNGLKLESWGEKVAKNLQDKDKSVIKASDSVETLKIDEHEEEEDHGHSHGSEDPHIWLDPLNMDKVGYDIKEELVKLDNDNKEIYEQNYKELSDKLKKLDSEYKETLKDKKQDIILVSHEAFGYLANRYGLKQIAVTGISPQAETSPKALAKLIDISKQENIEYIFFEVLSNPKSVEMLAKEANLKVLTLNPLGGITQEQLKNNDNYITIMKENLKNLQKALVD